MTHTLNITNGAAHVALHCIQNGITKFADLPVVVTITPKLLAAQTVPSPEPGESGSTYTSRHAAWCDTQFAEFELADPERDLLRKAASTLEAKDALPMGPFQASTIVLCKALGLVPA